MLSSEVHQTESKLHFRLHGRKGFLEGRIQELEEKKNDSGSQMSVTSLLFLSSEGAKYNTPGLRPGVSCME
jgi:hypothetical protein